MRLNNNQTKLQQVAASREKFHLVNLDNGTECVAIIRDNGLAGGAIFDRYAAFAGTEHDITEDMITVRISQAEADELEISL